MLVLSRKAQQTIRIGDSITVTILNVKGNTVRVGIDAPREVRVIRGELPVFETPETSTESRPSLTQPAGASQTDAFAEANDEPPEESLPHRRAPSAKSRLHPLGHRIVSRPR